MSDWPTRPAQPGEHDALADMWHKAWHEAHDHLVPPALTDLRTVADFRARLTAMLPALRVAGPAGAPLGLCAIREDELYQLFVASEARGTGLARALLADAETRLAAAGVRTGWLDCVPENTRAVRFYRSNGWAGETQKIVRLDMADGHFMLPALILTKTLAG